MGLNSLLSNTIYLISQKIALKEEKNYAKIMRKIALKVLANSH